MLKEIVIILGAIGCIFLWVPLYLLSPNNLGLVLILPLFLLSAVLAYAAFNVKKLVGSNQRKEAGAFIVVLLIMIFVAIIVTALITSYLYSQLHPPRLSFS